MTPDQVLALEGTFSTRVAMLRHARHMTRRQLAGRAGIDPAVVFDIEVGRSGAPRGRRRPRLGEAIALAQALGVHLSELLVPLGGAR